MITSFFNNISYRKNKENDLSDITWALCNASPKFKEVFLKFFFPEIQLSPDVVIEREISKDDSRPDFVIHNGSELYIIENKINDQAHHFGQYEKAFKVTPERFGYIANYTILQPQQDKTYQIRTWENFYKRLENTQVEDIQEKSLIDGYRIYVKNVCNIINFSKPMNIDGIYSLYELMELLNKLCNREEDSFSISVYNQDRTCDNSYAGHTATGVNFELLFKKNNIQTWGWIGIYYDKEKPTICIGFTNQEGWGKTVYNLLEQANCKKKGILTSAPYIENPEGPDTYWFDFTYGNESHEDSFNQLTLDEQMIQLKQFMDEVFDAINSLIQ